MAAITTMANTENRSHGALAQGTSNMSPPRRVVLLLAIALALGCVAGSRRPPGLTGTWVLQFPDRLQGADVPGVRVPKYTLTLNDDGTFSEEFENHIMMTIVGKSWGKYICCGDIVTLNGTREDYIDDGYSKGTHRET